MFNEQEVKSKIARGISPDSIQKPTDKGSGF